MLLKLPEINVPDGHGMTYKYQPVLPGDAYPVDNDLIIWLTKGFVMNKIKNIDYHFEYQEELNQEDEQVLFEGIIDEAVLKKKMDRITPFGIFIKDSHGIVLGGASGFSCYGCLYVDMLWLKDGLRKQGLGKKLMLKAEKIGLERRCTFSTVDTMDWEALSFYQKIGYSIEFVREGFEKESKMYMLRKKL